MTTAEAPGHTPAGAAVASRPPVSAAEAALAELPTLDAIPVEQHVEVYERAHRQLQDAMADTDDA